MSKIEELNQAKAKLEIDLAALRDAESDLSFWKYQDMNRSDGSGSQDARHDKMGRDAQDRVDHAKNQVEKQKALVQELEKAIQDSKS